MLYTADALAAAFVVPHPDDYRALHPSLVLDLFGELIHHYTTLHGPVPEFRARIRDSAVGSLADLRAEAARHRREWAEFHDRTMAGGLPGPARAILEGPRRQLRRLAALSESPEYAQYEGDPPPCDAPHLTPRPYPQRPPEQGLGESYTLRRVRTMGPFALSRFLPPFRRNAEQHIGETITHEDGRLAYLKTFRLSEAQVRRGHLLTLLAAHDWHLKATADAQGVTLDQLASRIEHAGFGTLLRQDIRDHYRAASRHR